MFGMIPYANRIANRANISSMNPFNDDFFRAFFGNSASAAAFSVDVEDKGDRYIMKADLPGVEREKVRVTVDGGVLTIAAETISAAEENRGSYVYRERRTGSMKRAFNIDGVSEDGITAEYRDGVLVLNLPKLAEAATGAREIAIN